MRVVKLLESNQQDYESETKRVPPLVRNHTSRAAYYFPSCLHVQSEPLTQRIWVPGDGEGKRHCLPKLDSNNTSAPVVLYIFKNVKYFLELCTLYKKILGEVGSLIGQPKKQSMLIVVYRDICEQRVQTQRLTP